MKKFKLFTTVLATLMLATPISAFADTVSVQISNGETVQVEVQSPIPGQTYSFNYNGQSYSFSLPASETTNSQNQPTQPSNNSNYSLSNLPGNSSLKNGMTLEEYAKAYEIASQIANKYKGLSEEEMLKGIYKDIRQITDASITYSTSAPHYSDVYGFFVLNTASCAGATRATGLCLTILGIPYEHVNENMWSHQWCRVNVNGVYWICDSFGLYVGPEPAPYTHPYLD